MLGTVLIVILILALLGALPRWPHSRNWGYAPTGGLGLILIIVVILLLSAEFNRSGFWPKKKSRAVAAERSWRGPTPGLACSFL